MSGNPFLGLRDVDGRPIADADADPLFAFLVVWIAADESELLIASSDNRAAAERLAALVDPCGGRVEMRGASSPVSVEANGQTALALAGPRS